jgi:hypothetical protein
MALDLLQHLLVAGVGGDATLDTSHLDLSLVLAALGLQP